MWTAEIVLEQVDIAVFQDKNIFIQRLAHHAQSFAFHVTRPPSPFISRACCGSHHERTKRTHLLSGKGSSPNASNDTSMEGIDVPHICGSVSMMDAMHATVVGSACAGLEIDACSGHKVRSSDVCSVGDTRWSSFED